MSALTDRIRERMDYLGWKPLRLAAAVEVSEKTAQRWYDGANSPHADILAQVIVALGVNPLWLMGLVDDPMELTVPVGATAPVVAAPISPEDALTFLRSAVAAEGSGNGLHGAPGAPGGRTR